MRLRGRTDVYEIRRLLLQHLLGILVRPRNAMLRTETPGTRAVNVGHSNHLSPPAHQTQRRHVRPGNVPRPDDGSTDRPHAIPANPALSAIPRLKKRPLSRCFALETHCRNLPGPKVRSTIPKAS